VITRVSFMREFGSPHWIPQTFEVDGEYVPVDQLRTEEAKEALRYGRAWLAKLENLGVAAVPLHMRVTIPERTVHKHP
jgi:hypothetical protein